jgi:hypothetical protein
MSKMTGNGSPARIFWVWTILTFMLADWFGLDGTVPFGRVAAREIVATREWTLLRENDTVAAGMHVRMDLSTGEKWVKLPDEDDNDENNAAAAVEIQPNDGAEVSFTAQHQTSPTDPQAEQQSIHAYDFVKMHETLTSLPEDEQARMGGIPALPGSTLSSLTPEQREAFATRMAQLWEERQAELREFQAEFEADLPAILRTRIAQLQDYLRDPSADALDPSQSIIVSVLRDLEDQLVDLDMARDFHTLGGWPVLVALVTDDAHQPQFWQQSPNQTDTSTETASHVRSIQAHAAWVLGTAVKNTGEFAPWALEELTLGNESSIASQTITTTSTLRVVLDQFLASTLPQETSPALEQLQVKTLYALGSLLRGNALAQARFLRDYHGPDQLASRVNTLLATGDVRGVSRHTTKLTNRLMALAADLLAEANAVTSQPEHASAEPQSKQRFLSVELITSFTTQPWCSSLLTALERPPLQETALTAVVALAAHCDWDDLRLVEEVLVDIRAKCHGKDTGDNASPEDSFHEERASLASEALQLLRARQ